MESVRFDFGSLPDHGHSGTFKVPDAHLLFSGDYLRSGSDLIISDHLHRVVLPDYFHGDKRPLLVSPDGAPLDANVIDALTGYTHYAQAAGAAGKVVGHVVKMTGSASIVRNGVTIVLNNGDAVYQTDVVQTGSNSTLGLVLVDGTTFNLTANARLMLNDLTYDPTSTSNTALFTLVQGAASFVAGQVAKTGDMKVGTPVATIGIRGTAVILDISSTDGTVGISVVDQQDGQVHAVQVFKCVSTGVPGAACTAGDLIGTVTSNGPSLTLTPAANFQVVAQENSKTAAQVGQEFNAFQQVLSTYDAGKQLVPNTPPPSDGKRGDANPQSTTKSASAGSSTPPGDTNSTQIITTPVSTAQHLDADTEPNVVVTPLSSPSVNPTQSPSLLQAPFIQAPIIQPLPTIVAITSPVAAGNIINQSAISAGFIISGTATAGNVPVNGQTATVAIVDSSNVVKYTYTTTVTNGAWSVKVPAAQALALADGNYSIQATVLDTTGSTTTTVTQTITVDTVPPTVTISTTDTTTNQPTQKISGHVTTTEAAAGGTVTLYDTVNGVTTQVGTAAVGSGGAWSTSVTLSGNGTHSIVAKDTDVAGNTGASTPVVFALNTAAPTIAITTPVAGDNIINKVEAAAGVTISGTATAGSGGAAVNGQAATIAIVDSTNAVKDAYAATVTGGVWSVNVTAAQALALADGSYSIKANVSDTAGNSSTTAALTITLDTTAPSGGPPVLTAASDSGTSHTDGITDVTAPTFAVALNPTVAAGDTVKLLLGGSPLAHPVTHTVTAADITAGSVSLKVTAGDLGADGSKSITAQFTDLAGNSSTTSADVITLDTTAPVVAIGNTGGPTNQPSLSLTGTIAGADAGTTIAIFDGTTQVGVGTISGGTWSASVTLSSGSNVLTAHVTDAAGNTNTSSAVTYTLSTTAPTGGTPVLTAASDSGTSHADDVTNVTAPTFTVALGSTVVAGDTVQLLLGGSPLAHPVTHTVTAADITAGSVSLTVTAGDLGADGSKQIAAQFSDSFGNSSTTAALGVTLDTIAPAVAITSGGGPVNQAAQTISGTGEAGTTINLFDNGSLLQLPTVTVGQNGLWSASVTLANGSNSLTASDTDAAGNAGSSSAVTYTLSTVGPTVTESLSIDSGTSSSDRITSNDALTGTGLANTVVHFTVDGSPIATTVTANAQGNWSFTPTGLADGPHTIVASQTDGFGNTGTASLSFTLDTTVPAVAITTIEGGDNLINAAEAAGGIQIGGTAEIGSTLTVNGAAVTVDGTGHWTTSVTPAGQGALAVTAIATDAAGNSSSTTTNLTVDTIAPAVAITSGGGPVNQAAQTISGTGEAGTTINLFDNGSLLQLPTVTVGQNGLWSASVTLANGSNSLTASDTDAAGNAGTSSAVTYTLSTVGPTVTESLSIDSGTSSSDRITSNDALTGTGLANTVVHFTVDGSPIATTVTANAQGNWSFTPTGLADGPHTIVASQTDGFGNTGTASLSFTLDTTVPAVAITTIEGGDNLINAAEAAGGIQIGGTAEIGSTLTVNGAAVTVDGTGHWTTSVTPAGQGALAVTAIATDAAGNSSTTSTTLTVDTIAPAVAITSGGGPVNQAAQTISGTGEAGTTINLFDNGSLLQLPTVTVGQNGLWSASVTLANGSNSLTASDTDAAGNAGSSSAVTYTLSTVGPTVTESLSIDSGTSSSDRITSNDALTGTGLANTVVHFTVDGSPIATTVTANAQGNWSFTPTGLADGPHTIVASQTDGFGNTGTASLSFTLDTTVPAVAITTIEGGDNLINAAEAAGGIQIGGTAEIGSTLTVNGAAVTVDGTGHWTTSVTPAGQGALAVTAIAIDAAGNSSTTTTNLTVDTIAPAVAITTIEGGDNLINAAEAAGGIQIGGTAEIGSTLTVNGAAVTVDGTGHWTTSVTPAGQGALAVTAIATDAAGNSSSTTTNLTVDTIAPAVAITSGGGPVNQAAQTISGTGEAGTTINLFDNGSLLQLPTVTVGQNGLWSASVTLANGSNSLTASDTDAAGNAGTSSAVTYTLSTVGPTVTESLSIDSGTSSSDRITSNDALTGTGLANTVVHFTVDGSPIATTVTANAQGNWSFTPTGLADGPHTIVASQTDGFGNTGTASLSFTLDTTVPAVAITTIEGGDNLINAAEAAGGIQIGGTAEIGSTLTVNGAAVTVDGTGHWTTSVTPAGQGALAVTAIATDAAGNSSTTTTNLTVDTIAPAVAITSGGGPVNQAAQTISGTGEAGTTINLFDNGSLLQLPTVTVGQNGLWSASVTLANGSNSLTASDTDAAGNAGTSSAVTYTLSTIGPTVTESLSIDTGSSSSDRITSNDALTGTGLANTVVHFTVDGSPIATTVTANAQGNWSFTPTGLADGPHTIVASQTDGFGNTGTASLSFTLDTIAPAVAITTIEGGDNIINAAEAAGGIQIGGTAEIGSTLTVNGATVTVDGTGHWTTSVTPVGQGALAVTAVATDAAGNSSSTTTNLTVDTIAPAVAITTIEGGDNLINAAEAAGGIQISGTAEIGSTLTVNGAAVTVDGTGHWTTSVTPAGQGALAVTAIATDAAGNSSTTSTTLTVDTIAPAVAITTIEGGDNLINAAEAAGGIQIGGTAEIGSSLTVNGAAVTVDGTGHWTTSVTPAGQGALAVTAIATDAAGNSSTTTTNLTVDTIAPAVAITTIEGGDNIINAAEAAGGIQIGGTAEIGSSLTVNGSAVTVDGTGHWTTSVTAVGQGALAVTAIATDAAGNSSSTSTTLTVDTIAPAVAITTIEGGDNLINAAEAAGGIQIGGTAEIGSTLTVNGAAVTVDGTGHWTTSVTPAGQGTLAVTAIATDAAGNTATTTTNLTVDTIAPSVAIGIDNSNVTASHNTAAVTFTFSEAPIGFSLADTTATGGTLSNLQQIDATHWTALFTGSSNTQITNASVKVTAASYQDTAGNPGAAGSSPDFSVNTFPNSWSDSNGGSWTDAANWSSGTVPSSATDALITPYGSAPYTITLLPGATAVVKSLTVSDPNATILDEGTLSVLFSLVMSAGFLQVSNGGTLSLGGAAAFTVDFTGTGGNLVLGSSPGFTGTVNAISTADGTVAIGGGGNVTTISADAIDLTALGGTQANPSNLSVVPTGAITGAANGIAVIQNAFGNIAVATSGPVIGQAGRGIFAEESATGVGSVLVGGSGAVTGTGAAYSGIVAEILNAANASDVTVEQTGNISGGYDGIHALTDGNGNVTVITGPNALISGGRFYGIEATSNGTGSISVTTTTNDIVTSGSAGINAYNQATSIPQVGGITTSSITVTAVGTINSGSDLTGSSSRPAGILAGYKGAATTTPNAAVFGNVLVNNSANINAAGGDGIRAYNYGSGNVTVHDLAGTTIVSEDEFGVTASSYSIGNVAVTIAAGDIVNSGSSGVQAINLATAIAAGAASSVSLTANGTISSGTHLTPGGSQPQGISAGYFPGNAGAPNTNVNGSVVIDNFANVTAAAGWGVDAYNYGNGSVTVTDEANTTVSGAQYGIGAYSLSPGSGSVNVNVGTGATISAGKLYGLTGIVASSNNAGNISITTSTGDVINSGGTGISAGNQTTSASAASQISVTTFGIINSGFDMSTGGGQPGGIWAGYTPGGVNTVNSNVHGNVVVDNSAVINAASGVGIGLYNWGAGNLTATLESSSAITARLTGVTAYAQGGGNVSITNHGAITVANGVGISVGTGTGTANSVSGIVSISNTGAIAALGSVNSPVVQINNGSTQSAVFTNSGTVTANLLATGGSNLAIAAYNGGLTVNNTGTISGSVGLATATFNNNSGGIWNVGGSNWFGNGANAINNAGTINIFGTSFFTAAGTLAFNNSLASSVVNVEANAAAFIGGAVTGSGTFTIGDRAELEFASSVAAGQTVSFFDGSGLLTLDNPSNFHGTIAGLAIGDAIELNGVSVASAAINGSVLTVTETNSQTLTYQIAGALAGNTFSVLSGNEIILVPASVVPLTGSSGPLSFTPSTQQLYILSNKTISGGSAAGFNVTSADSTSTDYLTVQINQASSISGLSGSSNGVNLTTTGANIALINAGTISSGTGASGKGINTNSTTGSTDIIDYGNVTGGQFGIDAHTSGVGPLNIVVGGTAIITGTTSYGILAISTLGVLDVSTLPGITINSASSGILAENQGSSVPQANNSSISVSTAGTINSGSTPNTSGSEPAGIVVGFLGGTTSTPTSAVAGNVNVSDSANINAAAGMGIDAFNYGVGNLSVSVSSGATITAVAAGATALGFAQYGIFAFNYEAGNTSVTTASGSTINSGSSGINAANQATAISAAAASTVTVVALGAINSGANLNNSGSTPGGILAGFNPGNASVFNASVAGNVLVEDSGAIVAAAGDGINAYNYGIGNVEVDLGFGASISALVASTSTGRKTPYGIAASNYGPGDVTVITTSGNVIQAGGTGIDISNQAASIAPAAGSVITVSAAGTISSGTILNSSGSQPGGIQAGYSGGTTGGAANTSVNGTVIVNNAANITAAAGWGIDAYNYGNGDVTVNDSAGTTITGAQYGIAAYAESGGTGNVAVNVYSGATINTTSNIGILAFSTDIGNISVITSSGDTINSGGVGINAVNEAAAIPASASSLIVVTAFGTINSGSVVTGTGRLPAGIAASYLGGGTLPTTFPLTAINGDVVVNNFANITAAAGDGIRAFTYGIGNVTVNDFAGTITALDVGTPTDGNGVRNGYGIGINANNEGTGDIHVSTVAGTVIHSGGSGIAAVNMAPAPSTSLISVPSSSEISVLAYGTINSGTIPTAAANSDPAAGILAGYNPNNSDTSNNNVHGNVSIDDYASILAAAGTDGIRADNYGTGTVTIIAEAGATITAGRYGIGAFGYDGGDVSVTNHAYVTGATAAIDALATSAGTVFIDNYGMIAGDVVSSGNATFHNEVGAIWNLAGSSTFTGTSELINDGAIDTTGISGIATSGVLSLANTGVVEVQSGSLGVAAGVTGLGSFTIDTGGLLEFAASLSAGSIITFQGTAATLKLDDVAHFAGSVTGFAFGDTIDLVGISPASVSVGNSGPLQIGYGTGSIALGGNYNPADFTVGADGHGGTDVTWNHQAPVISTSGLTIIQNGNGTMTITGLQVSDSDAAASTETFTMTATTGAAGSGTGVSPSTGSGLLSAINSELGTGITYNPGITPPSTDKVALTVSDGFGATDTVNFVFNLASGPTTPVTLVGTSGKDVILATGNNDALTGGGGADQFVFNKTTGAHTITDFSTINDHIDLTALSSIVTAATLNAWLASNVAPSTTNPADTVISLGSTETITLHNVLATSIHASDFIIHA
ncbi:Ig-like domain-containing protein [Bradyrhizobium erythrophlei]|uniref:Ig-like domain-containing protein n=1 Tax=Bradyrhizobium erythrophlei TaxID=1437360 RepID=UPI0009A67D41|nr:Ig-like domain-containing protein [Bradyrhizobium erythrophlei]